MKICRILSLLFLVGWWSSPASALTLIECLKLAQQNNPTLQAAALDSDIAAESVTRERGGYLPQVDGRAAYTWQKDPQAFMIAGRIEQTQEPDFASAGLSVEQTLYDFGRTSSKVGEARALEKSAEARFRGLKQDVFLRTTAVYYSILQAQALRETAEQEVKQFADHQRVADSLFRQGKVTRNDVLQAQVQLATSRQLLLARKNQVENAWLQLNYLTGRPAEARGELEAKLPFSPDEPLPPADAVENRPDLEAQRLVVTAGREAVRADRGEFWPTFFARGAADYVENEFVVEQTIYSAMVGMRINFFDGFSRVADYQESALRLERERRRLKDMQGQARLEYRTALNDVEVAAARVTVAEEAIRQAEENLRINRNRYGEQVGTATDVIDAQTLLTRTRTDHTQALFDFQLAVARAKRAGGELEFE